MTVKTISNLNSSISSDLANNTTGAITPTNVRGTIQDTVDTLNSVTGWAYYQDSTHTSGSPLAVNNARVQFTVNGSGANTNTTYLPSGMSNLWAGDKITPENIGDAYEVRVDFTAEMNSANGYAELQIDIGSGSQINIVTRTVTFAKGTGVAQKFSFGFPIFCLSTFVSNGGKIYLDTSSGSDNMDVYDKAVFISRINKGV